MIEVALTCNDFLSLYTCDDNYHTRSVYCCKREDKILLEDETELIQNKLIILDNLNFDLIISIHTDIKLNDLINSMISSYSYNCFNEDDSTEKGLYFNEINNTFISNELKEKFKDIDKMNREDYKLYKEDCMKLRRYIKQEEKEYEMVNELGDEYEKSHHYYKKIEYIPLNNQILNIKIIRNALKLPSSIKSKRRFPNDNQFKLSFDNHIILSYFFNRFKKPLKINNQNYNIKILNPLQLDQLCEESNSEDFIANRLISFKRNNDFIYYKFNESQKIKEGLLHPSCINNLDNNHFRIDNNINHLINHLFFRSKNCISLNQIMYNTLYIDLSTINYDIFIVNFNDRIHWLSIDNTIKKKKKKDDMNNIINDVTTNSIRTMTCPVKRSLPQSSLTSFFNKKQKID